MCFDTSKVTKNTRLFLRNAEQFSSIVRTYFSLLDIVKFEIIKFYMHLWFHCFNEMTTFFETIIEALYTTQNGKVLRIARKKSTILISRFLEKKFEECSKKIVI